MIITKEKIQLTLNGQTKIMSETITIDIPPIVTFTNEIRIGANVLKAETKIDFSNIHPNSHEYILNVLQKIYTDKLIA